MLPFAAGQLLGPTRSSPRARPRARRHAPDGGTARRFTRTPVFILLAVNLVGLFSVVGCGDNDSCGSRPPEQPLSLLTRNLYLGAELSPLFSALTPDDLRIRATAVWGDVQASRFEERVVVLAREIAQNDPDVVALQEVSLFRTQSPGDWQPGAVPNAQTVELDFLQMLQNALVAAGKSYQVARVGEFTDEELPAVDATGGPLDVRLTDRNVTLVRAGLSWKAGPAGAFATAASIPAGGVGGATVSLRRGYVATDLTLGEQAVRVVNTHLEVGGVLGRTQEAQTAELLTALSPFAGHLVLAGDLNSPADASDTATYDLVTRKTDKPFRDAWGGRQDLAAGGETCCLDLTSAEAAPQQRIDLVLVRGDVGVDDAAVIAPVKTPSGLWPSDHLGVVARLQVR